MFDFKTDQGLYIHLKYTLYVQSTKILLVPQNSDSDSNIRLFYIAHYKVIAPNLLGFFPLFLFRKAISFPLNKAITF